MQLILIRHGNTFLPNETPRWIGATEDLPLVESGRAQARALGEHFAASTHRIKAIYTSPLKRATETAEIIAEKLAHSKEAQERRLEGQPFQILIEKRLNEIHYGDWRNLTNDEVKQRFGNEALAQWEQNAIWPDATHGNWQPSATTIINHIHQFTTELIAQYNAQDTILLISSNGILRYFLTLIKNAFETKRTQQTLKMKTGHYGCLYYDAKRWCLQSWNTDCELII